MAQATKQANQTAPSPSYYRVLENLESEGRLLKKGKVFRSTLPMPSRMLERGVPDAYGNRGPVLLQNVTAQFAAYPPTKRDEMLREPDGKSITLAGGGA